MNIATRFNKFFVKGSPDECWEWVGAKARGGYGMIRLDSKMISAHRLSLEIHLGRSIEAGMCALHSCDNPSCVNPSHLREGTLKENTNDMISRGRRVGNKKLTWDQVADIRSRVGQTQASLAKEFGIDPSQISLILNRKSWIVGGAS